MFKVIWDFLWNPNSFTPAVRYLTALVRTSSGLVAAAVLDGKAEHIIPPAWNGTAHDLAYFVIAGATAHGVRVVEPKSPATPIIVFLIVLAALLGFSAAFAAVPVPIAPDQALGIDWSQGAFGPATGFQVDCTPILGGPPVGVSVQLTVPCQDTKTAVIHAACTPPVGTWWTAIGQYECAAVAVGPGGTSPQSAAFPFDYGGFPPASPTGLVPATL